jgi:glycine cleavage system H protein
MNRVPNELKYTKDHEWVREDDDGTLVIGITDHAQRSLGDLVFVELPEVEDTVVSGDACAVVESVKAASDVYCPLSGIVSEVNTALVDAPELVNSDPYGEGWLFRLRPNSPTELEELLADEDYAGVIAELDD